MLYLKKFYSINISKPFDEKMSYLSRCKQFYIENASITWKMQNKSGWFKWLFALVRPVGLMAFTNYLMQSFMCGLFFYGIEFAWYGKLQRYEIYYMGAAAWVIEIIWSHIWLRYFRFGPLE